MTSYKYSGKWKTTGFVVGNTKWHSGHIAISCDVSGFWRCSLEFNEKRPVTKDFQLTGKTGPRIKNVNTKNRLQINLQDGTTINVANLNKDQLSEVGKLLMEIQKGKLSERGDGQKLTPLKTSMPGGHQSPCEKSPMSIVQSVSPHFTSPMTHSTPMVGENHGKFVLFDTDMEDFKENMSERTPGSLKKSVGKRFLESGQEKSRDTLAHLSTSGFYGNKTGNGSDSHSGVHGPVGIISGIKRRPGLMPQFPERKKLCVNNSPSSGYTWQRKTVLTSSNDRQTSLHGFSNLGNTCYMNAILQSLFALETFTADLWTLSRKVKKLLPHDQVQGKLYNCLSRLLAMKWRPNATTEQHRTCLAGVKRAISVTAKRFSGQDQHDAHEFLSQVLDQLKEEVIKISKDLRSPSKHATDGHQMAACDGVAAGTSGESQALLNPTNQNFEFEVQHIIRCLKHEVTKEESFHDLSLDMPCRKDTTSTASLQDALDQFLRKELIEYTCAECQHKRAEVTHKFVKLPRILVLHLKRYCFNVATSSHTKTGRPISIARYLTLEGHCMEDTTPAYPAPEPCSPMENRPKSAEDNKGPAKGRESTPQHRGGFNFHRPFLSLPHTLELEEGERQEQTDTGKRLPVDKEDNSKDLSHKDSERKYPFEMTEKESEVVKPKTPDLSDFNPESLTEEQMLQMAVEQSMQDSHSLSNSRHDNQSPWQHNHYDASSPGGDTYDSKSDTGVLTNANKFIRRDSGDRSVVDSDRKVQVCHQCGANCYFVSSLGRYLCDCVTDSGHRKPGLDAGDAARNVSHTPRKLDFVTADHYGEPRIGETAESGPCLDRTGHLVDGDGRRLDEADRQEADFNHLVEMADLDDDIRPLGGQRHQYTETQSTHWDGHDSGNDGPSLVLDLIGEEDDKENKTPPPRDISAASVKDEPDWLPKTKESEERDFLLAVENSLRDQELAEQEQLSAITRQSLHECERKETVMTDTEEEVFIVEDPEEDKKREMLLRNGETGELGYSYRLMSVVSHLGSSSSLGHYVSDVYDVKQQRWYSYNDSDVMRTSEDIVRKSRERCGYIFFYLSKEINEDLRDWFVEKNRESIDRDLHTRPVSR